MFFALKNAEWEDEAMKCFGDALNKTVLQLTKCPKGLILHVCDFYIEEIAKVADGDLSDDRTQLLIEPFLIYYTKQNDPILLRHIEKTIINQLLSQSELGQEYQEKYDIWKQANFPTSSIDDIEIKYQVRGNKSLTDDDLSDGQEDDEEEERPLDPRAGQVNVVLTEISFDALKFAETLENLRYKQFATSKSRKGLARMAQNFRKYADGIYPLGTKRMPGVRNEVEDNDLDLDLKAIQLAEFQKKLAIGDVDSESSDFDEDLDNRKHGKLKRKSNDPSNKTKEKKQKLSKLHNERFFKATEDFSQDNTQDEEEDEETNDQQQKEIKIKKKKKKSISETPENTPRKIKLQKRKKNLKEGKEVEESECSTNETPKKAIKLTNASSPSKAGSTQPFEITDEWTEPLKEGEVEFFVPSKKQKLKALQQVLDSPSTSKTSLVLNPFAKSSATMKKSKNDGASTAKDDDAAFQTPPPRIKLQQNSNSSGKRVIIALNKNKAQSENDYIKQVRQSPNLPTNNLLLKPTKSLLKPNVLNSPINPFYQKKIGLKMDFNKSM